MSDCVFCKIISGEIPCHKIYEDDDFIAFLDIKPLNPGNSLLIPKTHYRWVYDVPNFGQYFEIAKIVGLASAVALNAMSISYLTLGFEVPHAHIRIIPRFDNDKSRFEHGINTQNTLSISNEEMLEITNKIKSNL